MRRPLLIIIFVRTVLNMAFRIVYPFLPAIARGLGISLASAGQLVALRGVAGLIAPLTGPFADRYGRRRVMEAGLLTFAAGTLVVGLNLHLWLTMVAFLLTGVAKSLYDPAMQAYLSDRVPYHARGQAMGLTELSWAAAWLIGVPAAGFIMERFGWRAPWLALALLGVAGWLLTARGLPRARVTSEPVQSVPVAARLSQTARQWGRVIAHPNVARALATSVLVMASIETVLIVYGAFLEENFGLSLGALGLASTVIGVAEVIGEFGSAGLVDRFGKRRSIMAGLVLLALSFLLLPLLTGGLVATLAGVMVMMVTFEFSLITLIPLVSELVPEWRADVLSMNVAAISAGRVVGALL
ncbi:MAG TPA: MFS transporter, partial [Ardenticatenaceae bacterium]|nr:MFS transporter [Ardenticatenaceae bacterium]